jgi:hypothetical protein
MNLLALSRVSPLKVSVKVGALRLWLVGATPRKLTASDPLRLAGTHPSDCENTEALSKERTSKTRRGIESIISF